MLRTKLSSLSLKASRQGLLKRGFTLIELLVVVGIIAILSALAYPAYQNYGIRARVSEAVAALASCQVAVAGAYQVATSGPGAGKWGCEESAASKYVASITTTLDGAATATLATSTTLGQASGKAITLTPLKSDGSTTATVASDLGTKIFGFDCTGGTVRGTATINQTLLPSNCLGL